MNLLDNMSRPDPVIEALRNAFPNRGLRASFSPTTRTVNIEYEGKPSINKEIEKLLNEAGVESFHIQQHENGYPETQR